MATLGMLAFRFRVVTDFAQVHLYEGDHTKSTNLRMRTQMQPILGNAKRNANADTISVWPGL